MHIQLSHIGKRFGQRWIFSGLNWSIEPGSRWAVLGANGSGKSTLLQIVSGYLHPSEGTVHWKHNSAPVPPEQYYRHLSWCAPYTSLFEEFTLRESIAFHTQLRPLRVESGSVGQILQMEAHQDKPLRQFSSGMRQRVKLALAVLSDTPLLLLDEPLSHLDEKSTSWFLQLLETHLAARTLLVASNNHRDEIAWCSNRLTVEDFKPADVRV